MQTKDDPIFAFSPVPPSKVGIEFHSDQHEGHEDKPSLLLVFSIYLGCLHWMESWWKSMLRRALAGIQPKTFWKQVGALVLWLCQYSSSVVITGFIHI